MRKSGWRILSITGVTLLVTAFLPLTFQAGEPVPDASDPAIAGSEEFTAFGAIVGEAAPDNFTQVGVPPVPLPPSCLPTTPISCAGLPVPQGGSCSCSAQLLPVRCKSCDEKFHGAVLETTCTIRPAPCTGICDLETVITRTGLSCARP